MTDYPEVRLAELIMPNHTNHHGTLFGGHALGLMDHAGWVAATRCARRTMVTVASDRVEFKVPVRAGDRLDTTNAPLGLGTVRGVRLEGGWVTPSVDRQANTRQRRRTHRPYVIRRSDRGRASLPRADRGRARVP